MLTSLQKNLIVESLQKQLPYLLAIYAFGSQIDGTMNDQSDLDLAVLVEGYTNPVKLWELAQQLADNINCEVDLVDLRAASTVMQYQIIMKGIRWWEQDAQASIYESFILSEKTALDTLRADLLADIQREGKIYGR